MTRRCNQIRRDKPKGPHNPRTRNFQKLPHDWWHCTRTLARLNPECLGFFPSRPVWAATHSAAQRSHRAAPGPNRTHPTLPLESPRIRGSPASSGPFQENQIPLTSLVSDVHVKEDSGITGVRGLRLGRRMRHFDLQTQAQRTSWLPSSWNPTATLAEKTWRRRRRATSGERSVSRRLTSGAASSHVLALARVCGRVLCTQVLPLLSFTNVAALILFILFACVSSPFLSPWCRRALETVMPFQPQVCHCSETQICWSG